MKGRHLNQAKSVENPTGVVRKTLSYNNEAMLCHFLLKQGAKIPLHNHRATQIGYIVKGKAKFLAEKPEDQFEAAAGDSYVFSPYVKHGTIALEETEYVEVFVPARDEYKDF
ncbi:MAG: cupin domain-containing protein [Sedimentisphaerales bacterium]|nr:cupin domain-containing protein [Sedimentisphaerales bacterium]